MINTELDLPSESPPLAFEQKLRALLHEWLVVYNPFYFASALCFLAGVLRSSEELNGLGWRLGDLALFGCVQLYELALVGAAVLLWRAKAWRPATILLLLEALFFFDPTCEVETLIHLEPWDLPLAVGWLMLAAFKVQVLARAFGLRPNLRTWVVILGCAAAIVAPPLAFDAFPQHAEVLHSLALLLMLSLATVAFSGQCRFHSEAESDDAEPAGEIARNCLQAVLMLGVSLSLLHLLSWLYVFDLEVSLLHVAAVLVVWVANTKSEGAMWLGTAFTLLLIALWPAAWSTVAAGLGLLLAFRGWRETRPSLYGAALLCLDLALHAVGWRDGSFPTEPLWADAIFLAALIWLAVEKRVFLGLAISLAPALPRLAASFSSLEKAEQASALIVASFLLLAAGLAINLRLGKPDNPEEPKT